MNEDYSQEPIIVLGSPRSGTTLTSKLLTMMGVFMGYNVNNKLEDWFFIEMNRWMFDQNWRTWDDPLSPSDNLRVDVQKIVNRINETSTLPIDHPWGFKDPVSTFTAEVWEAVFPEAKFVRIYREPAAIAASLHKREKAKDSKYLQLKRRRQELGGPLVTWPMKSRRCLELQGAYDLAVEYQTYKPDLSNEVHSLHFEEYADKPEETIRGIAEFVGLTLTDQRLERLISLIDSSRAHAWKQNEELISLMEQNE